MIELTGLSKIFRTELVETHALRDISIGLMKASCSINWSFGLGKSTLLNSTWNFGKL